jgi:hypothetical protein
MIFFGKPGPTFPDHALAGLTLFSAAPSLRGVGATGANIYDFLAMGTGRKALDIGWRSPCDGRQQKQ